MFLKFSCAQESTEDLDKIQVPRPQPHWFCFCAAGVRVRHLHLLTNTPVRSDAALRSWATWVGEAARGRGRKRPNPIGSGIPGEHETVRWQVLLPGRTLVVVKRLLAWQHGAARLSLSAGTSEQGRLAVVLVAAFGYWEQALEIVEPPCSELTGGFQQWASHSCHTRDPNFKNPGLLGFPGGAVVESLPANAGDTGSSPGLGRSHMPRSNRAREPQLLSLRVWSLCSTTREAATVRGPRTAMKSGPRLPQLEKALAQKRRPNTARKVN